MAVTTTVQQIHNGALAKSSKNEPSQFAEAEVVRRVNKRMAGLYQAAARVNPIVFAGTANVNEVAGVWARPEDALSIELVQDATPEDVEVVPFDDQQSEPHRLCVYEFGQAFYAITTPVGAPTGTLTFFYARRPDVVTAYTTILDDQWREDFNELLELELAIDYAIKDAREDAALAQLLRDRNSWFVSFMEYVQHVSGAERRRFERPAVNIQELLPLLAGTAGG
jgi:hypothetical protein